MVLTETEKDSMLKNGIYAPGFLNLDRAHLSLLDTFISLKRSRKQRYGAGPIDEILARLTDFYDADTRMFISVSKYREIAASLGYYSSDRARDPTQKLYVFEVQIPQISVIWQTGIFKQELLYDGESTVTVGPNFSASETNKPGVEMFVPYKINPESIIRVDTPAIQPKWERHLKGSAKAS